MKSFLRCVLLAASIDGAAAFAATFTVTTTNVTGPGSLQQALFDANTNAGADTITFNIASGGLTISPTNALPAIVEPVTIDGATQPGFVAAPIVELNGTSAGAATDGLRIVTSNSTIRALVINRFLGDGIEIGTNGNNVVEGCYIGLSLAGTADQGNTLSGVFITNSPNNVIGGIFSTQRNFISGNNQHGVHVGGASATNNQVLGNVIGVNISDVDVGNTVDGIRLTAARNIIGGTNSGGRNVIGGNTSDGIEILGATNTANQILGNYIGTDSTGTLDRGNANGVFANNVGGTIIGGAAAGAGNLISGNSDGIELNGVSATNNVVLGNFIGTTAAGTAALANSGNGVLITTSSRSNVIGGINAGEANVIAFNTGDGINVAAATANTNNALRGNSIFSNGDLGIDLGAAGVTGNDAGDPDTGANQLQNFPELSAATNTGTEVVFGGQLRSKPSTTFTVDFYSNLGGDDSGSGEGQFWLGATNLTTAANSNVSFTVSLPVANLQGRYLTATATDPFGNTSEFATNVAAVSTVSGLTFTVVNTNDSGPGSLRQAINDANAVITTGDTIAFAITNLSTTISPASPLPTIFDPVVIDGYTQPGSTTNTSAIAFTGTLLVRLDGLSAGAGADGLNIAAGNCVVRGLVITRFNGDGLELSAGGNNLIAGNIIGLDASGNSAGNTAQGAFISGSANNVIGGTSPGERNVISGNGNDGIEINGASSSGNQILGNLIGLNLAGNASALGNLDGVFITGSSSNVIGGATASARNVIAGNSANGIDIAAATAAGNQVLGNYIGTDVGGTVRIRNLLDGIFVNAAHHTQIGGAAAGAGNLVSGNNSEGVAISGASASNNVVQGNRIGMDVTGTLMVSNASHGLLLTVSASRNTIGGTNAGEANLFAFNAADGVSVASGSNNAIRANAIFSNGDLGIDLGSTGVTNNDAGDADLGANFLQNFPVLTNATYDGAAITIQGTLNSIANRPFFLDFFASAAVDASGFGEGQVYLGSTNVSTDGGGNASFTAVFAATLTNRFVSATATDTNGNTSEFSATLAAQSTVTGLTLVVTNTNDSGPGSLREAILAANAAITVGDTITFAIPGAGPHTVAPASALPALTDPGTTIDGYTQSGASSNTLANGFNAVLKIRLLGANAGTGASGLRLDADNNVVRGLCIVDFTQGGVRITGAGNAVEGNLIGLELDGTTANPNSSGGVNIPDAPNNRIGGNAPAARNVISGNFTAGIVLSGAGATGNQVQGNFIGTVAAGNATVPNTVAVSISDAGSNLIGGSGTGEGNVIAGGTPVLGFSGLNATNNQVLGNFIGTDLTGTLTLGGGGVSFTGGRRNFIGGVNPGEGNVIAFNGAEGVRLSVSTSTNNAIRGNSIHDNSGLGIDLGSSSGVTSNDLNDVDTGFNALQNFPVLTNATITASNITISGTLNSRSNTAFALDFFSSLAADSSGFGEGAQFLGSTNVNTDGSGNASFTAVLSVGVLGDRISATATSTNNDTSEFSQTITATVQLGSSTFTVINTNDSGAGSLREAITQSNATIATSNNLIRFAIAGAGPHVIRPLTPLPNVTQPATIDGYTQTNASANTLSNGFNAVFKVVLDGSLAGAGADGLRLSGSNHVVRGLLIRGFIGDGIESISGGGQFIEGNLIASNLANGVNVSGAAGNTIGGTAAAQRNLISSNALAGVQIINAASSNNLVQGNFIGTDAAGVLDLGNGTRGVAVFAAGNLIGGTSAGAGNVIAGNTGDGVLLSGATGNTVQGNRIGTDAGGLAALANGGDGIALNSAANNLIGGTAPGAGNLISGNLGSGVELIGVSTVSNVLQVNLIGTDATGENPLPNAQGGVLITANASNNRIGGSGNVIAFNTGDGVAVITGTGNAIRHNSIFENTELGIDLENDGVTANDTGDGDSGANNRQNFPVLSSATANTNNTVITGSLNSAPNTTYELDFFASPLCDDAGNGEGRFYLGSTNVTTGGSGNINFTGGLPVVLPARQITATATDPAGNTSEHCGCLEATSTIPAMTFTVTNVNDSGPGSLRLAISNANAAITATNDTIAFNIPGPGPFDIGVVSPLPDIVDPVTIDGSTQPAPLSSRPGPAGGGNPDPVVGTLITIYDAAYSAAKDGMTIIRSSRVTALRFAGFRNGITIFADRCTIEACAVVSNANHGIRVTSDLNLIGRPAAGFGNFCLANGTSGICLEFSADHNEIKHNFVGLDAVSTPFPNGIGILIHGDNNTVGGADEDSRNYISGNMTSGVRIEGFVALNNRVSGNFIGTDFPGILPVPNGGSGVLISTASSNLIGGLNLGENNTISGNNGYGVRISGEFANFNFVHGNYIGPSGSGQSSVGNGAGGVWIEDAGFNHIGSATFRGDNSIAANTGPGVRISGASAGFNRVLNNGIGKPASGGAFLAPNTGHGIEIAGASNTRVGGTAGAEGNRIRLNGGAGVHVTAGLGNAIRQNSIHGNAQLGIDLLPLAGVTQNDPVPDPDEGANREQNFPILTNACWDGQTLEIFGVLISAPTTPYDIEFFLNSTPDPSGHGEGEDYLGLTNVTTDANGRADFAAKVPAFDVKFTDYISATATDPAGNTSEFSSCLSNICSRIPPYVYVVFKTNYFGGGSLYQAITDNNNSFASNINRIVFSIPRTNEPYVPGTLKIVIRTNEYLPPIERPVIIDGCNKTNEPGGFRAEGAGGSTTNCDKVIIDGSLANPGINGLEIAPSGAGSEIWNLVVVGFSGDGVKIGGSNGVASDGNLVQDSCIFSNNGAGIRVNGSNNQLVGNQIEFNQVGIVGVAGTGNRFDQNSIASNTGLGLDLNGDGVINVNDYLDADTGANNLQNFPALTGAFNDGMGNVRIVGGFQGSASTTISAQFFANASLDASGFGEGACFIGQTQFNTDGQGNGSFDATFAASVPAGQFVTATATDAGGNTSEFSAGAVVQDGVPANLVLTGPSNSTVKVKAPITLVYLVANTGPLTATGAVFNLLTTLAIDAVDVSQGSSMISSGMVNCALGTLPNGGTATVTVFARPTTPGAHTNRASVVAAQLDHNLVNNSNLNVVATYPVLDLAVTVSTPTNPPVGSSNVITITVTNRGPANAPAVFVQSARPPGSVIVGTSNPHGAANPIDDFVMFEIGLLAAGQSKTVTVTLRPELLGLFRNAVEVFVPEATEATPADNLAIAEFYVPADAASADVEVKLVTTPAIVGHGVPYQILARASNRGPAVATGVIVGVNLPANSVLRSNHVSQGAATPTGSLLMWNVGTLTPGGPAAEVTLEAESYFTRPFNDQLILAARAIADALDPELTNNLSSVDVNVQPPALDIVRSNNNLVVSYPITARDFQLQAGYNLTPPGDWAFVAPFLIGSNAQSYTYSFSPLSGPSNTTYFRLVSTSGVPVFLPVLSFYQYHQMLDGYCHPFSEWGAADVTFLGSTGLYYFNLAVGSNWLAQNVPLVSVKGTGEVQTVRVHFPLDPYGKPKLTLSYKWGLTTNAESGPPVTPADAPVYPLETVQFSGHLDRPLTYLAPVPAVGGTVVSNATAHPTFPNREQGKGECTPAAVLNSLEYLNTRYNLNIATQHLTMDAIKDAVGWTTYGTPAGVPFLLDSWMVNKQQYMDANNIPIETIVTYDPYVARNALLGERDVEMDIYNHTLCVRSISDLGTNNFWLTLSDDLFQGKGGGLRTFGARLELGWYYKTVYGKFSGGDMSRSFDYFIIERPK